MIPLTIPVFDKEMEEAAIQALNNEMYVAGESVHKFEEEFAKYIGTEYAIAVNSGSSALLLTFCALNLRPGDKVVAPSATFIATLNGAVSLGATPIFCEINNDYVISTSLLEQALAHQGAKFAIPVHLYGHPCNMTLINEFAKKNGIIVVEDVAQAHGAKHNGQKVGSFGTAAIFSFYPTKNMTVCGDGGMVTTNDDKISQFIRKIRDVGRKTKYTHDEIGYTMRLNSVNAAIGRIQLRHLDKWNEKRRTIADIYYKGLAGIGDLILPPRSGNNAEPVYHMFVVRTSYRNALGAWLAMNDVGTGIHYPIPVHRQPAYRKYATTRDQLNFTDEWSKTVLSLPIHPKLEPKHQEFIIDLIIKFFTGKLYQSDKVKQAEEEWSTKLT